MKQNSQQFNLVKLYLILSASLFYIMCITPPFFVGRVLGYEFQRTSLSYSVGTFIRNDSRGGGGGGAEPAIVVGKSEDI